MKKRILVTGAAGYIGGELSSQLLQNNYEVIGVDNLFFGQSIPEHFKNKNFSFIKEDISKELNVQNIIKNVNPDVIIHLAAIVGLSSCQKWPVESIMTNTESVRLLLKHSKPSTKFIMPNTNSQYGTVDKSILCDEDTDTKPISLYSVTKCIAEELVKNRPNSLIFRLATVYGISKYRMRDELLVNFFVNELVKNNKINIFEGHFQRNVVYIKDVVAAFIHGIESPIYGLYNLGDDKLNMSKFELAQSIVDIIGGEIIIGHGNDPDKRSYNVSSQKLYKTGFKIQYDYVENIKKLKNYYEQKNRNN